MNVDELRTSIRATDAAASSYFSWDEVWAELGAKEVSEEISHESRWSTYYDVTVQLGEQFFQVCIGRGSTEMQENNELDEDIDSLVEVRPVDVVVTKYVPVTSQ